MEIKIKVNSIRSWELIRHKPQWSMFKNAIKRGQSSLLELPSVSILGEANGQCDNRALVNLKNFFTRLFLGF